MTHDEDAPSPAANVLMRSMSGFFARRTLSPHLSLAACRCSLCDRMRVVWRHDVFMKRVIHEKNGTDMFYTLRTSRSSGDAVLTNEKLPRVASRRREVGILRQTPFRGQGATTVWRGSRRRGQDAGSALLRDEAVHTAFLGHVVVSRLARFAQDSQSCDFTPVWIGVAQSHRSNLTYGRRPFRDQRRCARPLRTSSSWP